MKATGKLIDPDTAYEGDMVTIRLPKDMRVIGNCDKCKHISWCGKCLRKINEEDAVYAVSGFGCGGWRAK